MKNSSPLNCMVE